MKSSTKMEPIILGAYESRSHELINCSHPTLINQQSGTICADCGTYRADDHGWMLKTNEFSYETVVEELNAISRLEVMRMDENRVDLVKGETHERCELPTFYQFLHNECFEAMGLSE